MGAWIRGRVTYANVVSTLALVLVVTGGTAIALKGRNTVNSGDIKPGQVKTSDLANKAVTPAKLGNALFDEALSVESTTSAENVPLGGPAVTVTLTKPAPVTFHAYAEGHGAAGGTTCEAAIIGTPGGGFATGADFDAEFPGVLNFQVRTGSFTTVLPAGTSEFALSYRRTAGAAACEFRNRRLWAVISGAG